MYGSTFVVKTPDANNISSIALIRAGADTHAFDMDQRMIGLSFTNQGNGTLRVAAPANGNLAPPGYYMLFLVNSAGVPSVAKWMQIRPQGSFKLAVTPATQTVTRGSTSTYTVAVTPVSGFQSTVNLAVQTPNVHITASVNPSAIGPTGTSTLSVTVDSAAKPGVYTIRVVGTNAQLSAIGKLALTVQ